MSAGNRAERRRKERAARKAVEERRPAGRGGEGRFRLGAAQSWWRLLSLAVVFGVVGGFLEMGVVGWILMQGLPLHLSQEYLWMAPTAYVVVLGVLAAALIGAGRFWRAAATLPVVVGLLAGVAVGSAVLALEMLHPLVAVPVGLGVGVQLGRMARGRFGGFVARYAPVGALALGFLVAGLAAFSLTRPGRAEARADAMLPAPEGGTNIVLIILDTVRARSMGLYDAAKAHTPNLEQLGREGVVFEQAYSASPWTLPSHATMLTGRWPQEHGAGWMRALDGRYPTLAEALAGNGYSTAAFVGNLTYANHNWGIDRGFTRFEDYPVSVWQVLFSSGIGRRLASLDGLRSWLGLHDALNRVRAPVVTDRFLRWQRERESDRPFFAFLNYFDAHEPLAALVEPDPVVPLRYRNGLVTGESVHFDVPPGGQAGFFEIYRAAYESVIGELDREVGRLVGELERRGELSNTVVIVASDHGELIGEYDLFGHDSSLYLPTLRVPLLIRHPGTVPAGVRMADPASLRDLAATILDLAGARKGVELPGRSLASHWDEATGRSTTDVGYAFLKRGPNLRVPPWAPVVRGPVMESVIDSSFQYIRNGDGSEELYAVQVAPLDARNLAGRESAAERLMELRRLLAGPWPAAVPGPRRTNPWVGATPPPFPALP